jgi:hypothetical protein
MKPRNQEERDQAAAEGRCTKCGNENSDTSRRGCPSCRMVTNRSQRRPNSRTKRRRAAKRKVGVCVECDNLAVPGCVRCAYHLERAAERAQAIYNKRKDAECCINCDNPPEASHVMCRPCLDAHSAGQKRRDALHKRHPGMAVLPMAGRKAS